MASEGVGWPHRAGKRGREMLVCEKFRKIVEKDRSGKMQFPA